MVKKFTSAQLIWIAFSAIQAFLIATTFLNVWYTKQPLVVTSEYRSIVTAQNDFARTSNEIARSYPGKKFLTSSMGGNESSRLAVDGGQREGGPSSLSIRDFVEENAGYLAKKFMSIVSWDSDGKLETYRLRQQCAFRNYTEAATWPYLLREKTVSPSPHGVIALLLTTDNVHYEYLNWTVESPLPILTFTVPVDAAQNPWVRLIPTPYELKGGARRAVGSTSRHLIPFKDRRPIVMYRGGRDMNPEIRGRAFELAESSPWMDATESFLPKNKMVQYRYLLDIGGISGTTWIALRWKMCSGSLVFKVDDPVPTMDWWHGTIQPWKHYIPVRYDLSDLHDRWKWAEGNQDEAFSIAEAGKLMCQATLSKESQDEAVDKALLSLPPASRSQRKELTKMFRRSAQRLEEGLPPLMFLDDFHLNPGRRFNCT